MSQSRYIKTVRTRLPREKRTIRIHGAFEDSGKYQRCWNCGFIVDMTRLGGSGHGGDSTVSYAIASSIESGKGDKVLSIGMDTLSAQGVIMENGPAGTPRAVPEHVMSEIVGGCPSCGCSNL